MHDDSPTSDQWRRLFDAAIAVKDLGPWEWMLESEVFGFQDPVNDRLDFVSVMGARGEHLAIAVYLGERAVYDFCRLENSEHPPALPDMLEIPHLQASFEDRDLLEKEDRAIIKQLGLKFRGRQEWPMFRSYRPGFFPWFVDGDEVETLICALDQVLDVVPRLKEEPLLLGGPEQETFLVRRPNSAADGAAWSEQFVRVPAPEPVCVEGTVDSGLTGKLRDLPRGQARVEADLFPLMVRIQAGRERPAYPYVLMLADADEGIILGVRLLQPENGVEEMWQRVPEEAVKLLLEAGVRPAEILFNADRMGRLLASVGNEVGVVLNMAESLEALEAARAAMADDFLDPPQGDAHDDGAMRLWESPDLDSPPHAACDSPSGDHSIALLREGTPYAELRRGEAEMTRRVLEDMPRSVIYRAAREMGLLGRGNVLLFESEEDMCYLWDRCLYDIAWEGATLIERFIATQGADLGVEDLATLDSMAGGYYSLFEVADVAPGQDTVELTDLLGEHSCTITDVNLSHSILPGLLMATRVIGIDDLFMTTGASCPFEPHHKNALIGGLKRRRPAQGKKKNGKKHRSRPRSEYSAYFFRKYRLLSGIVMEAVGPA